jgi:hypothetical protein
MSHAYARTILLLALLALQSSCAAAPEAPPQSALVAPEPPMAPETGANTAISVPVDGSEIATPQHGATTFLLRTEANQAMLFRVVDDTLQAQWPEPRTLMQITRWDDAASALEALDEQGGLTIAPDGTWRYLWAVTGPEVSLSGKRAPHLYRPDGGEIAYEREGDIYSRAPGQAEQRWTSGQRFTSVTGWVDADTLTVQAADAQGGEGYIVRRNGQIIEPGVGLLQPYRADPAQAPEGLLVDRSGRTRFVAQPDGSFLAPGAQALEPIGAVAPDSRALTTQLRYLDWSGDNQTLFFFSSRASGPAQLLALSERGLQQVGAELQVDPDGPVAWAIVPGANQLAVVAEGPAGAGVYLIEAGDGTSRLLSSLPATRLVGVDAAWLALVVSDGAEAGSYLVSLSDDTRLPMGGEPFNAAGRGPDGLIWLIGPSGLWRFDPQGDEPATAIAASAQLAAYREAALFWPPIRQEPLVQVLAAPTFLPTPEPLLAPSATAVLQAVPLAPVATQPPRVAPTTVATGPGERRYVTISTYDGFVAVRAEPSTQSRELQRLSAGTVVICTRLVTGELIYGTNQWAECPSVGGFILAALLNEAPTR